MVATGISIFLFQDNDWIRALVNGILILGLFYFLVSPIKQNEKGIIIAILVLGAISVVSKAFLQDSKVGLFLDFALPIGLFVYLVSFVRRHKSL